MHNLAAFERMGWAYWHIPCPAGPDCKICRHERAQWWQRQCGPR
jgi:hypothetical protein